MRDREKALEDALRELVTGSAALIAETPGRGEPRRVDKALRRATAVLDGHRCSHCKQYERVVDGKIGTHDWPLPCRALCHGVGKPPWTKPRAPRKPRVKPAPLSQAEHDRINEDEDAARHAYFSERDPL